MKKGDLEFKVGVFVVGALALLGYMVLRAGEMYIRPGYTVKFVFDTVSGIDKGSPVRLAGVPIGEVKKFHTLENKNGRQNVEIEAFIDEGVKIEKDADLRVATMGFLGEKYIDVYPGTAGADLIAPGDTLVGRQLTGMDDVFDSGQKLIQKMEYVADDLRSLVGDEEFKNAAKGTFVNGEKTFSNLESATADLKDAAASTKVVMGRLRDGEGTLGKLLKEDKVYKDLEAFVSDIKKNPWKLLKK